MEKVEIINAMLAELKKRGLWQQYKDVAERLGMNRATVSSAIHGHPNGCTQSFIFKLNEAYGSLFNPEWLISGKGHMLKADADLAAETAAKVAEAARMQIDNSIHQHNASNGATVIEGCPPDMTVQLLRVEVENLRKDNARLEAEKKRLEAKVDELQQVIISQLTK